MKALLKRDVINILRNPIILRARIIQTIFLGIFIGGLFFNAGRDYTGQESQNDANSRALLGCLFFLSDGDSYKYTNAAYQRFVDDFGPDD